MSDKFYTACEHILPEGAVDGTCDPPVFKPPSVALLTDLVRCAVRERIQISVVGGATYPSPPAASRTAVVSTCAVSDSAYVDPDDFIITLPARMPVDEAFDIAADAGLDFPLELLSGDRSTIGGAYMTRASGVGHRLGTDFCDSVLGIECIVYPGELIHGGGRTIKNVTGYDLPRFFAGSMGLFGILTQLIVKLTAASEKTLYASARFENGAKAIDSVSFLRGNGFTDEITLAAPQGLAGETVITMRISGSEALVKGADERIGDYFSQSGVSSYGVIARKKAREISRNSSGSIFCDDTVAVVIPPAAFESVFHAVLQNEPDMPCAGYPASGRFWFGAAGSGGDVMRRVGIGAVGGKQPVSWRDIRARGVSHMFGAKELAIIRSLKRELDPYELFNPQMMI